jgi:ribosomal protein L37AE/L43A
MKTATTLRLRPAATSAQERANVPTTCQCCGREGLKRTVKMTDGAAVLWLGTGCAAKAMGVGIKEYQKAADAVQSEADKAAQAAWRAEDARWGEFLTAAAGPGQRFEQIARLGGGVAARARYAQWCAALAA